MAPEAKKLELIQMILMLQDEELLTKIRTLLSSQNVKKNPSKGTPLVKGAGGNRQFGFAKGLFTYVSPDFDENPLGFEEYMPEA